MEDEKTLLFLSPALLLAYANMINNMEIGESRHPSPPPGELYTATKKNGKIWGHKLNVHYIISFFTLQCSIKT